MDAPDNYAKFVKAIRKAHGWDQLELARRMGVAPATISRWENSHYEPSGLYWEKLIAISLGTSVPVSEADESGDRWVRDVVNSNGSKLDKLRRMTQLARRLEQDMSTILTDASYVGGVQYWIRKHDALLAQVVRAVLWEQCARMLHESISNNGLRSEALAFFDRVAENKSENKS